MIASFKKFETFIIFFGHCFKAWKNWTQIVLLHMEEIAPHKYSYQEKN